MANKKPDNPERRKYMRLLGGAGMIGAGSMLAGCSGGGGSDSTEAAGSTPTAGEAESTTAGDSETTAEADTTASGNESTGGPSEINKGGELIVGMQADRTDPLWPHWASDAVGSQITRHLTNTLTWVDDEGTVHGDLAEEPPQTEDAQTYTFKIREGVMFHEPYKRELTADDVVKNWLAILDPSILAERSDGSLYEEYPTAGRWPFPGLLWGEDIDTESRINKVGDYEVEFELAKPSAAFPALVSIGQCAMLPMEAYEENADSIGSVDHGTFGTGPFIYDEGQAGNEYTITRNPDYWGEGDNGQLPYLDAITYRIVPEASVRLTNLRTGDIHLAESVPPKDVETIEDEDGLRAISKPGASHLEHYMNIRGWEPLTLFEEDPQHDKEPVAYGTINEDGKKARQAIRHATNTKQIIETKFDGKASPKYAPPPPFDWSYQKDKVTSFPYDPETAQQYLQETGNEGLQLKAWATNQPRFVDTATIAQQTMSQAGIQMEVLPKEKSAVWGPVQGHWDDNGVPHEETGYESHFEDIGSGLDPADYFSQLFGGSSINYTYFATQESDDLILQAAESTDREKRKELYGQALEEITPLAPMNGICWPYVNQGVANEVKNYQVKRSSFRFRLHDVWIEQ